MNEAVMRKPGRGWKSRLAKIGVVVIATLFALTGAELVLRSISPKWDQDASANALFDQVDPSWNEPDPELGFARRERVTWEGKVFDDSLAHHVVYRTDSHGFRNPPSLERAPLVVIGDSFVEAGQVPEEAMFTSLIAKVLEIDVANLGRGFYGPQQELIVLKRYAETYEPDVIVWCFFEGNDIQDARRYREFRERSLEGTGDWWERSRGFFGDLEISKMWGGLKDRLDELVENRRYRFELVGRIEVQEGVFEDIEFCYRYRPRLTDKYERAWRDTQAAIEEAVAFTQEKGWQFLMVYLPIKIRVMGPFTEFESGQILDKYLEDGRFDHQHNLSAQVKALCETLDVPFVECLPALREATRQGKRPYILRWDNHLDLEGHEVVSEVVVDAIDRLGWRELVKGE